MNAQMIPAAQSSAMPLAMSEAESAFTLAQRQAKALSQSDLVPQAYRNNLPNTLLAIEVANRIGASPFLVMQNLYIVQGKPSWSSSFLIATVNACGRFTPIRFETDGGDDPKAKTYRVRAFAKERESGEVCHGPWVTWAMVEAEGWNKKSGSKWLSIPGLMFMYRAATFFARLYAPEVSMGISTADEAQDVWGGGQAVQAHQGVTDTGNLRTLEAELTGQPALAHEARTYPEPTIVTFDELKARIEGAADTDALDEAYDLVSIFGADEREQLTDAYNLRRDALELGDK